MDILIKLLLSFIKEERLKIIFLIMLSCILNILKINVISFISANIIKAVQENNIINIYTFYKYFIIISVIFIVLFNIYKIIQNHLLSIIRQWLRYNMVKYLFIDNYNNLTNKNFTKIISPLNKSSIKCYYMLNHVIDKLLPNLSLLLIVFIYFLYKNIIFGLIFLIGNIIMLIYISFNFDYLKKMNEEVEENILENEGFITEIFNNFDKIIYRGTSNNELNILWEKSKEVINISYNFYQKVIKNTFVLNIILFSTIFLLIYYLIYLFINKNISTTIFITFLTILLLYRDIMLSFIQDMPEYLDFVNRTKIINKIFDNDINMEEIKYNSYNLQYNTIIFKNISYKYNKTNKYILNNFNLKLDTNNKIIGITGVSGRGKSTLAKILIKLYKYDGDIYIDNVNIRNINSDDIRKDIVYVNQNTKLFDKKVIENIMYGCNNENECYEKLQHVMNFKKINELFKNIGYNKVVGHSGDNISGGQRQVINIINGLIIPSKIVILDEPTNALDAELKKDIISLIKYFKQYKKCIIIISHDSDVYDILDEKIEMNKLT